MDEELQAFDEYINHVKGLAPKTRRQYLCITRRLLSEQFSEEPVVISTIKPEDVRQFTIYKAISALSVGLDYTYNKDRKFLEESPCVSKPSNFG